MSSLLIDETITNLKRVQSYVLVPLANAIHAGSNKNVEIYILFFNIESRTKRSNCQSYIKYKCEMSVLLEMLYVEIKVLRHL